MAKRRDGLGKKEAQDEEWVTKGKAVRKTVGQEERRKGIKEAPPPNEPQIQIQPCMNARSRFGSVTSIRGQRFLEANQLGAS